MSKKKQKKKNHWLLIAIAGLFVLVIAWALVSAFFDLIYNFLMQHPWVYLLLPAMAVVCLVLYNQDRKKQKAEQEKRIQQEKEQRGREIEQMLSHREADRRTQEEARAQAILSYTSE